MPNDFDRLTGRLGTHSSKWSAFPADVLPLWIADMDFPAAPCIQAALHAKVEHGIFGYEAPSVDLMEVVAARMNKLYGWQVGAEMLVAVPGVISGFNLAAKLACQPGEGVLVQPPVYPPFLQVHKNLGLTHQTAPLHQTGTEAHLRYEIDWDAFEAAIGSGGARTGMFLLCNPHNPVGRVWSPEDLTRMAEICLKNNVLICSDEIHAELLLAGARHTPIASLSDEIAARTITLISPSKAFNVAGLYCAFAILPDARLRKTYRALLERQTFHVSSLGLAAAQAAYDGDCDGWLAELNCYLTSNRDFLVAWLQRNLPQLGFTVPEATYLAWLDCTALSYPDRADTPPWKFFLDKARVALNDGITFGEGGAGFVRLNFGCPRATMLAALERMKIASDSA